MKAVAIILSSIAFFLLLYFANVEMHFMPLHVSGPESGLIEGAFSCVFGGGASLLALLFASVPFFRSTKDRSARWVLAWCSLVFLGFIAVFIVAGMDYRRANQRSGVDGPCAWSGATHRGC